MTVDSDAWRPTTDCATPPTTGPVSPPNVIRSATTNIGRCAPAATDGHARALRSVPDRLLNVACAMLRDGACFDPHRVAIAST